VRQIHIPTALEEFEFAKRAAKKFEEKPDLVTYTDEDIKEDELFAVKWGLGNDCILVFKIGDEPRIYAQIIAKNSA